jgi:hypothetical protein
MIATSPRHRPVRFWAKRSIWENPLGAYIFDGLEAVPVRTFFTVIQKSSNFDHPKRKFVWFFFETCMFFH